MKTLLIFIWLSSSCLWLSKVYLASEDCVCLWIGEQVRFYFTLDFVIALDVPVTSIIGYWRMNRHLIGELIWFCLFVSQWMKCETLSNCCWWLSFRSFAVFRNMSVCVFVSWFNSVSQWISWNLKPSLFNWIIGIVDPVNINCNNNWNHFSCCL